MQGATARKGIDVKRKHRRATENEDC